MSDASMLITQTLPGTSVFVDAAGLKGAQIDAGSLAYSVDNTTVAAVITPDPQNASDPLSFQVTPNAGSVPAGTTVTVSLSMRATSGAGATTLTDSKSIDVVAPPAGVAAKGSIVLGQPR